jgi:hypothetical protein
MLDLGHPGEAMRYLNMSKDSARDLNALIISVRDATMGEVPAQVGIDAAKVLAPIEQTSEPADSARREVQRAVIRVMEPWRLSRGDTSQTRRSIQRLRALTRNVPVADAVNAELEVAFIEMLHANVGNAPSLRRDVARVDSLLLTQDVAALAPSRLAQQSIFAARVWEKLGEKAKALAMIGRYAVWSSESVPYLALQLREQGRLAAAAGDRKRAMRSYAHYLGLRSDPESSVRPQVDSVRSELGRLQ